VGRVRGAAFHDVGGDQISALDIPVDALQLGVARRGLQNP
jgi:hypothetical protein